MDHAQPPDRPAPSSDGTGALILGILSIVTSGMCGVGLIFAIVGLRLSRTAPGEARHGTLQAGFICSIIGLILGIMSLIVWLIYLIIFVAIGGAVFGAMKEGEEIEEDRRRFEELATQYVADERIRLVDSRVERTADLEGRSTQTVFWGDVVNDGDHAIRNVTVEIEFQVIRGAGGARFPEKLERTYSIYVPPGERRRLVPEEITPPPGWDDSAGTSARIKEVELVYRPEQPAGD